MKKYIITEDQYELYQKTNNFSDTQTPVSGEIVWRALAKANDNLGEALRLVQMCIQYSNEYPGLEQELIEISQDILSAPQMYNELLLPNSVINLKEMVKKIREKIPAPTLSKTQTLTWGYTLDIGRN
jgi:hypothetical protein